MKFKYAKAMAEPFCKYFHFLLPLENQKEKKKGKKRQKLTSFELFFFFRRTHPTATKIAQTISFSKER